MVYAKRADVWIVYKAAHVTDAGILRLGDAVTNKFVLAKRLCCLYESLIR